MPQRHRATARGAGFKWVCAVVCVVVYLATPPALAQPLPTGSIRPVVIFDADMDWDDAVALAYLAGESKLGRIDLRAVTVDNNGAGLPGRAIQHARCLLDRLGLSDVPVADGADSAPNEYPPELRQRIDRIVDSVVPGCTASEAPSKVPAPQLIRDTVAAAPAPVHVIGTGTLTNLAAAGLDSSVDMTLMGGAVRVPGNLCCGAQPYFDGTQEFNLWIDPQADRTVLASQSGQVRLIPLDATNDVPITAAFLDRLRLDHQTTAAQLAWEIAQHDEVAPEIPSGTLFWWDVLTAASAIHPEIVAFEPQRLDVMSDGPSAGRTVPSPTGRQILVGTSADTAAFEQYVLDTLNTRR